MQSQVKFPNLLKNCKVRAYEFPLFNMFFLTCYFAVPQPTFGLLLREQAQSSNVNHCCFIAI